MTYPPPNEAGQSVHVCRAAPVCAAVPYWATLTGAWVRIRNRFVGRGILDASMAHSIRGRQGCRPLHPAEKMAPTVHPTGGGGGGHGAVGDGPGDCAICGWRFGRLGISRRARRGNFARCGGRPKALPLETAIWATRRRLARGVGEEFCVRARPSFAAILDVWQEAGPQLWRKRPGDTRRHTGGKLPYRKKTSKTFISLSSFMGFAAAPESAAYTAKTPETN